MKKYQQITEARTLLELPERATMEQIKANYRRLMRQWHPDRGSGTNKKCTEMTVKLARAYKLITEYCNQYKFSFSEGDVRHHLSDEEWLDERFSKDPVWGG